MRHFQWLIIFFATAFLCSFQELNASHIVGGQIQYKWVKGNNYEVTLLFYRDCGVGSAQLPNSVRLCFFDLVTNQQKFSMDILLDSITALELGDQCYSPPGMCIEVGSYSDTITIPSNPNGYYISHSNNARNAGITNIKNESMTYYAEMPDPALHNSSPFFVNYPKAYWCVNFLNEESLSATDSDGDLLKYYIEEPLKGTPLVNNCIPKPYPKVVWNLGFSYPDTILGAVSTISIDEATGTLHVTPAMNGLFVIAYRIEEWRAGVKIGEIRRDMQYATLTCSPNLAPIYIEQPDTNYHTIIAGDSACYIYTTTDPNPEDKVTLIYDLDQFNNIHFVTARVTDQSPDTVNKPDTVSIKVCIQTECSNIRETPYTIFLESKDSSCYGVNITDLDLRIKVILPGIIDLFPNIFTPNGDGINDVFKVNAEPNYCFDNFNVRIFSRWGNMVFESTDFMFEWNGKKNNSGPMESDGVYYYIITSSFQDTKLEEKGFVHLIGNK